MAIDYLVVGAGLFGSVFARQATDAGYKCLILEKRNHIAGNCFTEKKDGIDIHKYGPHIFHTNNREIWEYVNKFAEFNNFINRPKVNYKDKIYSFPINLMTLYQLWGIKTPKEAAEKLESVKIKNDNPNNLEDWILSQVGIEIYETFIRGYTRKQWGTDPSNLPSDIIKRLPIRLSFDDNYYFDKYQGIPKDGYTTMFKNILDGIDVELETNYFDNKSYYDNLCKKIVYTGPIDRFFDYCYGELDYRSLEFVHETVDAEDFQGNAVVNYTDHETPFTRIIEHKHFNNAKSDKTHITKEYPKIGDKNSDPYYPINNDKNLEILASYKKMIDMKKYIFGGRLAEYKYYDMHQVIGSALKICKNELSHSDD